MVHVVRDDHKRACLAFDPGAGSEEGNLEMPPMRRLYFILLLDFGVLTKVKLEEAVGVQVYGAKTVELQLLMPLHQYVHLEALQVLSKLDHDVIQPDLTQFCFSKPLFLFMVSLFLPPQMIGAQIF